MTTISREEVLRRLAMSSAAACRQVVQLGLGTDNGIRRVLSDASALCTALAASTRLRFDDLVDLFTALPTEETNQIADADIARVRRMNTETTNGL